MSEIKIEIVGYSLLDKCKCCLGDGPLRDMWLEYKEDGKTEIYGEMLNECFDLTNKLQHNVEINKDIEQICESCIFRLRDALDFQREILACAQLRFEHIISGYNPVKQENEEDGEEIVLEEAVLEEACGVSDNEPDPGCAEEQDFVDVEYLELDEGDNNEAKSSLTTGPLESTKTEVIEKKAPVAKEPKKRKLKWPKKKSQLERLQSYRQYTRDVMMKALAAVQRGELTTREASKEFNVPRRTLATWLLNAERQKEDSESEVQEKVLRKKKHFQFIDEVKKILTYTNAMPFNTKTSRYYCTYCSTDGPLFEDPDELRIHTRTKHVDDKTRNIEIILRPIYNEVLKVDIDSLHCTVCCSIILTWAEMFQHLEETHEIELDEAYTKVIPYILKRDLSCVLCNDKFPNFHHLDAHMNIHYANYVCSECGDTFLSYSRLTKHTKVHRTGSFPCKVCGKVFTLQIYMQKHYDSIHKHEHNIKCVYCPEKFYGTYQRHLHLKEKHKEKICITTCELCGMKFEYKQYYVAHMRRKHKIKMS